MWFSEELRQTLGGQEELPDDWTTTANVVRETGKKVLGVSSDREVDKETWWWMRKCRSMYRGRGTEVS